MIIFMASSLHIFMRFVDKCPYTLNTMAVSGWNTLHCKKVNTASAGPEWEQLDSNSSHREKLKLFPSKLCVIYWKVPQTNQQGEVVDNKFGPDRNQFILLVLFYKCYTNWILDTKMVLIHSKKVLTECMSWKGSLSSSLVFCVEQPTENVRGIMSHT